MEDTINAKHNYFMGTIMICVVYGILAILMLSVGYFTTMGKEILFNTLLYFTVTFVIGTIFVIIITTILILVYEPPGVVITTPDLYSNNTCPDYWTYKDLTLTDKIDYGNDLLYTSNSFDCNVSEFPEFRLTDAYKNYKCVPDNTIYTPDIKTITTISDQNSDFMLYLANMQKGANNCNVSNTNICDKIFPEYLAYVDNQRFIESEGTTETNFYRCKYATTCGIPWTGAGCS
jgi:hypothetical protein